MAALVYFTWTLDDHGVLRVYRNEGGSVTQIGELRGCDRVSDDILGAVLDDIIMSHAD